MKKEDLLQKDIEEILHEMGFIESYEMIWKKYCNLNEAFQISDVTVYQAFTELGYEVKKIGKDQFFTGWFVEKDFKYKIGISIKYNMIHFDFSVKNEKYKINSGGDFGLIVQLISNWQIKLNSPSFCDELSFNSLIHDLLDLFNKIKLNIFLFFNKNDT